MREGGPIWGGLLRLRERNTRVSCPRSERAWGHLSVILGSAQRIQSDNEGGTGAGLRVSGGRVGRSKTKDVMLLLALKMWSTSYGVMIPPSLPPWIRWGTSDGFIGAGESALSARWGGAVGHTSGREGGSVSRAFRRSAEALLYGVGRKKAGLEAYPTIQAPSSRHAAEPERG